MTSPMPLHDFEIEIAETFLLRMREERSSNPWSPLYQDAWTLFFPILRKIVDRRTKCPVFAATLRKLDNGGSDSDDIVQQTACKVFARLQKSADFKDAKHLLRFIHNCAKGQCLAFLRKSMGAKGKTAGRTRVSSQELDRVPDSEVGVEEKVEMKELTNLLVHDLTATTWEEKSERQFVNQVTGFFATYFGEKREPVLEYLRSAPEQSAEVANALLRISEKGDDKKGFWSRFSWLKSGNPDSRANTESSVIRRQGSGGEDLDCTAFAPPTVSRGAPFMLQVFVHLRSNFVEAEKLALESDFEATRRGKVSLSRAVEIGEPIEFHLHAIGANCDDVRQILTWRGKTDRVCFLLTVRQDAIERVAGRVVINIKGLPVGQIVFSMALAKNSSTRPILHGEAVFFDSYFASYSSHDRPIVLRCVQTLRLIGKKVRQDILDLDPGERWENRLYEFIRECDATLLFWSHHAKESEWVLKECVYCKEQKGVDRILPLILATPPPKPWPELSEIHMNDKLAYLVSDQEL